MAQTRKPQDHKPSTKTVAKNPEFHLDLDALEVEGADRPPFTVKIDGVPVKFNGLENVDPRLVMRLDLADERDQLGTVRIGLELLEAALVDQSQDEMLFSQGLGKISKVIEAYMAYQQVPDQGEGSGSTAS